MRSINNTSLRHNPQRRVSPRSPDHGAESEHRGAGPTLLALCCALLGHAVLGCSEAKQGNDDDSLGSSAVGSSAPNTVASANTSRDDSTVDDSSTNGSPAMNQSGPTSNGPPDTTNSNSTDDSSPGVGDSMTGTDSTDDSTPTGSDDGATSPDDSAGSDESTIGDSPDDGAIDDDGTTDDGAFPTDDQTADDDDNPAGACQLPQVACDGVCTNPLNDPVNCGGCGIACEPLTSCQLGSCEALGAGPDDDTPTDDGLPSDEGPPLDGESASSNAYPCDGDTASYDAVVTESGGSWTASNGSNSVYSGNDMRSAIQAAIDSLSSGRSSKESVLVQGSGSIDASSRVNMKSHTLLNVCGTIDVVGSPSGDNAPVYGRGVTNIEIPNISITGNPAYGIFFRESHDLTFGRVELRVTGGLGVRVDSGPNYSGRGSNLRIDYAYVEGASNHAVETYGIDGIQIGTVIARDVGYSGLLLNDSTDAEIGLVDGDNVATGQGYAVFRMANRNGRVGNDYPANIHVQRVVARGGGRGIFCVSESGGAVIDYVDIENTANNSVLLENCYNVTVGNPTEQSRVVNSGELRVSARADEFENSRDVTFQNISVSGTAVRESPCANGSSWIDIDSDGPVDVCN